MTYDPSHKPKCDPVKVSVKPEGTLPRLKYPEMLFKGTAVLKPIGIGLAHPLYKQEIQISSWTVDENQIPVELQRIDAVVEGYISEIQERKAQLISRLGSESMKIIGMQTVIAEDLGEHCKKLITTHHLSAESAVDRFCTTTSELYAQRQITSHFVPEINSLREEILTRLLTPDAPRKIELDSAERVLVARCFTPEEALRLDTEGLAAVITVEGGPRDHVSILLENLNIPYVTGLDAAILDLSPQDLIAVNGIDGHVYINPSEKILEDLATTQSHYQLQFGTLPLKDHPPLTLCGEPVTILANAQRLESVAEVVRVGAQGIGLYRTEFLFLDCEQPPTEEEQFNHFSAVVLAAKSNPVTIRTFDFGTTGDKVPIWSNHIPKNREFALGLKGIRFSMADEVNKAIFRTHIRAILRASKFGPIKIMFPMINNVEEFEGALGLVNEEMDNLGSRDYDPNIQIGCMIETPSAVTCSSTILEVADFVSIGTNDLTEATLQVARQHSLYGHAFNEADPVVLGAIRKAADSGRLMEKPVSVCGAMASNPLNVPLLLGAGIRQFSVTPTKAEMVNDMISLCIMADCEDLVDKMVKCQRPTVARRLFEAELDKLRQRKLSPRS